ncbi:hypothetical protein BDY21DRAFT_214352 [Lineolata rhizophorae]|uniref:Cryptic loci regulator 2 N-terminal domain-containing protein n=1 Tax=Lineolata rhizophorae TaxID=578093 RepID=A0A6A6P3X5_9PEZI|nr:hypothetical protein BDY21DRAFT_214352 [Lineolata rhizophorae]
MAQPVIIPLPSSFSDGDPNHQPGKHGTYLVDPPTIYLEKLADWWMRHRGQKAENVRYRFDRLPSGYRCFGKARLQNPKLSDKWLYGHPKHSTYDSPLKFWPHFRALMENGGNPTGCDCVVCGGRKDTNKSSGKLGRPKLADSVRTDEEGTPDVYRELIDGLRKDGSLDIEIREPMSMDWRATREGTEAMIAKAMTQPNWIPRIGEIVLFVRTIEDWQEISMDHETGEYKIFDKTTNASGRFPSWEAGYVSELAEEDVSLNDLVMETKKSMGRNYSGFRIEAFAAGPQHKYVPLHQIRPFFLWERLLKGLDIRLYHASIIIAMKYMSSVSLLEKFHFRGTWPKGTILCKGVYLGAELLLVGDTIRLFPGPEPGHDPAKVTDVIQLTSIRLELSDLDKASANDYDDGRPYNLAIRLGGRRYTLDPDKATGYAPLSPHQCPEVLHQYDDWYYTHDPSKFVDVPFNRVLGRCYDGEAMLLWCADANSSESTPDISTGVAAVRYGRHHSTKRDPRIPDGKRWYWADCRAQQLELDTFNGHYTADRDPERDPKVLKKHCKVMMGVAQEEDRQELKQPNMEQRHLHGYAASSSMVRSALHDDNVPTTGGESESDVAIAAAMMAEAHDEEMPSDSQPFGRKRSRSVASRGSKTVVPTINVEDSEIESDDQLAADMAGQEFGIGSSRGMGSMPKKHKY